MKKFQINKFVNCAYRKEWEVQAKNAEMAMEKWKDHLFSITDEEVWMSDGYESFDAWFDASGWEVEEVGTSL